jgi:manganese transport system ATP-binding protein
VPDPARTDQGPVAVEAERLTLAHGTHVALREATFAVPVGVSVAIVGPNGSGKSTLLNAVGGLHQPVEGQVRVLGRSPADVRPRVAYVLQSNAINEHLPATVSEVVTMGRYAARGPFGPLRESDRRAVEEAIERMEVGDLRRRHLGELSGGQRQRVFVAQGLAQQGDVLLLDEPVTGLDLVSQRLILDAIDEELAAGRTVLMTTHDLSDAAQAGQVLLLAGRIVASGPPTAVLTGANLREAYGGRLVHLDDGTSVIDDPHHHAEGDDHTGHVHAD